MTIQEIYRCFWSGKNETTTRVKKPESFAAGVGRALRRAAKAARMYGTPIYVSEGGKVVANKP
jgi:4-hydroxy-3-methylbut-2-enyl diphosphate reductase IspH